MVMTMDKRKQQWCLVYKNKYVLRVGTWQMIQNKILDCPYPCRVDYRNLPIEVCKDMINSAGIEYFRNEKEDETT